MENFKSKKIQGTIYKIFNNDKAYYGSCSIPFNIRKSQWKHEFNKYLSGQLKYKPVFDIMKDPNHLITIIEKMEVLFIEELRERENEYIMNDSKSVNKIRAYLSPEEKKRIKREYYKKNKARIIQRQLKYYYNNLEKRRAYQKEYQRFKRKLKMMDDLI